MMKSLCCVAFDTLCSKLKQPNASLSLTEYATRLKEDTRTVPLLAPLFVTWSKKGHLRGCIGTFQELETEEGVKRFASTAAFQDSRFSPISAKELPSLEVSVTLLANFRPISQWDDWKIGEHGLKVNFEVDGGYYSGTFLPSVAPEQGWDKLTTMWYLLRKADFEGVSKSSTAEFYQRGIDEGWIQLERYDGLKSELTFEAYQKVLDSK